MDGTHKHVLFFSNHCGFCRAVVAAIARRNMRNEFVTVCVDHDRRNLPRFVDRVPLVLTAGDRRVLADDALMRFLGGEGESGAPPPGGGGGGGVDGGPDPLEAAADLGGATAAFLVGGDSGAGWSSGAPASHGYMAVGGDGQHNNFGFPRIEGADGATTGASTNKPASHLGEPVQVKRGGGGGTSQQDLDRMRTERDSDLQRILRSQVPPQEAAARAL